MNNRDRKDIDNVKILEMIANLQLSDFLNRCEGNLDYLIDNQGTNISGGENKDCA